MLCQISTFFAAGHETTSSALTWCLYAVAKDKRVQDRLRKALRELEEERTSENQPPTTDDLTDRIMRCTYLDWVVRESLRLHAPVTNTMRVCMREEDSIPVRDETGYVDARGKRRWEIPVRKWDIISIPIQAINKSQVFWGEDATAFR